MKRIAVPLLLIVALLGIAVAGWWLKRPGESLAVPCVDPLAGCAFSHQGAPAGVRFSMRPVPLEAFTLSVTAPGARKVSAEFQMVGMDMGFNRYDLRPTGDAGFASTITLPVCVTGRRDWMLYLDLDGTRYALPFSSQ